MGGDISKSKPILRYYIFQKKVNDYISNKIKNREEKNDSKEGYFVHPELIKEWKKKINYEKIYEYCENFKINSYKSYKNQTEEQKLLINQFIENDIKVNKNVFFIKSSIIDYNNFPYILNRDNFHYWETFINKKTYEKLQINNKNKVIKVKYIFKKELLIIFFKQYLLIKIVVKGKNLTLMFGHESIYENYKDFLKSNSSNNIIDYLERKNIFSLPIYENFFYKNNKKILKIRIINDEYLKKNNQKNEIKAPSCIDFDLINRICYKGLENVGATCYMNATLQCLGNIKPVTDFLLKKNNYIDLYENRALCPLTLSYTQVLIGQFLDKSTTGAYRPQNFKNMISELNPLFQVIQANDSKDLIIFLLEVINTELVKIHNKNKNITKQNENIQAINIFDENAILNEFLENFKKNYCSVIGDHLCGFNKSIFICQNCFKEVINFNIFNILIFSLEATSNYFNLSNNNTMIPTISFDHCFKFLSKKEFFQDTYCQNCRQSFPSIYREIIFSMPNYLIIILNRGKGNIFNCNVIIPKEFNSSNYSFKKENYNQIYELVGIVSHFGESGMGGHFIAFCKHNIDNKWRCYNDSIVTECQNDYLKKGTPYILFYKNKNLEITANTNLQNGNMDINNNNNNNNCQQNIYKKKKKNFFSKSVNPNMNMGNNFFGQNMDMNINNNFFEQNMNMNINNNLFPKMNVFNNNININSQKLNHKNSFNNNIFMSSNNI